MKTALITGATDGIGKQTALNIASENNHVIIVGWNSTKCKLVCDEISNKTNNNNVEYFTFDLSLITDNKALATKIKNNFNKIDILINNVGAMFTKYQETKEMNGWKRDRFKKSDEMSEKEFEYWKDWLNKKEKSLIDEINRVFDEW